MKRSILLLLSVVVAALVGALLFSALSTPPLIIPPLPVADIEAMPPEAAELRIANYWSQRLFVGGFDPGAWRTMEGPERQVWALSMVEQGIGSLGLTGFLVAHARQPEMPSLDDAREASSAMGLDHLAGAWKTLAAVAAGITVESTPDDQPLKPYTDPPSVAAAVRAYGQVRNTPEVRKRRRAYVLEHRLALAGGDAGN